MTDGYAYQAKKRLARPEDLEDLGALPDFFKTRTTPTPSDQTPPADDNPIRGLARKKPAAPAPVERSEEPEPATEEDLVPARRMEAEDLHRASSANLPTKLVAALGRHRDRTGMSAGDTIVAAIEQHLGELPALLVDARTQQGPTAGFSPRPAKILPVDTKLLPFRLTRRDFDHLDHLVQQLGARDRTHLIREALSVYLKD